MTSSSRRLSLWLIALILIGLGGAFVLSLFREPAARRRPVARPDAGQIADSNKVDLPKGKIPRPPAPKSDYLGSASCAECHPKIAKQYASHAMANSMAEVATAPQVEDFGEKATFTPDGRHVYSVEKNADGMFHHERLLDAEGQTIYDQAVKVEYVVGSGANGKSYIFERQGTLYMSPISWYSVARKWDLSPGYTMPTHPRFERLVTSGCIECHSGRANYVRGWENHFAQPTFRELSIGCERCHGPGGEHAAYHRMAIAPGDTDPIINPAKLDPARREDICSQCHMQGEGRIPNYGCTFGDFRPGQRLEETTAIFVKGTRTTADGKSLAVSHTEQMRSSVCYQKSAGKFGCTSCHDPHLAPTAAEKVEFYRQKCLACHQDRGCSLPEAERRKSHPNDSCTACHMARLTASNIPHSTNTDHRVLRMKSALSKGEITADELPALLDHAEQRMPKWNVDRARGMWYTGRAELKSNPAFAERALNVLSTVSRELPDDADVLHALGMASAMTARHEEAIKYWKRAVALEPNREQTLRALSVALQNARQLPEAAEYLKKYLEVQPWSGSMWGRYSNLQGMSGDWQGALASAEKCEQMDPSQPRIYQWLSVIHKRLGNEQQSQHYAELYERIKSTAR